MILVCIHVGSKPDNKILWAFSPTSSLAIIAGCPSSVLYSINPLSPISNTNPNPNPCPLHLPVCCAIAASIAISSPPPFSSLKNTPPSHNSYLRPYLHPKPTPPLNSNPSPPHQPIPFPFNNMLYRLSIFKAFMLNSLHYLHTHTLNPSSKEPGR